MEAQLYVGPPHTQGQPLRASLEGARPAAPVLHHWQVAH